MLHSLGYHQFAHTAFMEAMGNPAVSGALGAFALLGPGRRCGLRRARGRRGRGSRIAPPRAPASGRLGGGAGPRALAAALLTDSYPHPRPTPAPPPLQCRRLLIDGFRALWMGNPNMNSLVGVGSTASFLVGAASFLVPSLGLDTGFLEEPVMLLAFVLLGAWILGADALRWDRHRWPDCPVAECHGTAVILRPGPHAVATTTALPPPPTTRRPRARVARQGAGRL